MHLSRNGVLISILLVYLTLIACSENQDTDGEIARPDDAQQAERAVKNFKQLLEDYKAGYVARGAHAKGHACVRAIFRINDDIEARLQHGLFSEPGREYKSWIRFSNGHFDLDASQDNRNDARGMAVKVLEPPGEPLQIAANGIPTQDFLMTNSNVFFVSDIKDYNQLVAKPEDFTGFLFPSWNPLDWRLRELFLAKETLSAPPPSLLAPDYFSITAYKLGPHNIKFGTSPCTPLDADNIDDPEKLGEDFLRHDLSTRLSRRDACFNFRIQVQNPDKDMSVDDPTRPWSEEDAPFIDIARIIIPQQSFDSEEQRRFCENLSFAPWHALAEHRPIGQFNRLRRHVYPASSGYRHKRNDTHVPETLDW